MLTINTHASLVHIFCNNRAVLTALLAQGQHTLALKYTRIRRPPILEEKDVQLQISVLLQNGAIQVGICNIIGLENLHAPFFS